VIELNKYVFLSAGAGDFFTSALFNVSPLNGLHGVGGLKGFEPYTCCNDTSTMTTPFIGRGYNRYASDRIAVSKAFLTIDKLEGGSTVPGGLLQEDLGYKCHSAEEHAPIRAYITDARISSTVSPTQTPINAKSSKRKSHLR
jgi:hypothetical protein